MAGHSKWASIKRKKEATDQKRGKLFTKLLREVQVAARLGGGNPDGNPRLKTAIATAKSMSVPNDNIDRAVARGSGSSEGEDYEEITYEAYGPGGVAILITALTDNRNRTASEVRHALSKSDGSLGGTNSVAYQFERRGVVTVSKEGSSEEAVFDTALEAGALDVSDDQESWEVITEPQVLEPVRDALDAADEVGGVDAEIRLIPSTTVMVSGEELQRLLRLLEGLDDLDDVQQVTANFEVSEQDEALLN